MPPAPVAPSYPPAYHTTLRYAPVAGLYQSLSGPCAPYLIAIAGHATYSSTTLVTGHGEEDSEWPSLTSSLVGAIEVAPFYS